jgi:hypothetical protein
MAHATSRKSGPSLLQIGAALGVSTLAIAVSWGQALPDSILEFLPGSNAGFGVEFFPGNALGPPQGTLNAQTPNDRPEDVLALGTGGSITYEFSTHRIIDLPGPDFTVFENPVEPIGHPEQSFVDSALVAVSADGQQWHSFPVDLVSTATAKLMLKNNYVGFAGVQPSYSSTANGISPYDPTVSGGDQFDLADLGLAWIRFIRITDTGEGNYRPSYDIDGDLINDYGNFVDTDPTVPGTGISSGFDIDAVVGLHTEPWSPPASVKEWALYD